MDTTVIVRECGELTADICYQSLCEIFSSKCVFRISEQPFSLALKRSLELGIKQGLEFTLCIDADIIPIGPELKSLVVEMQQLPKHIPEIQGMIFDNLFRVIRPAGNHLYRTSFAEKAIQCIPVEGTSLRPESDMLSAMTRKGNPWKQSGKLVGYHDFGQRYEDIYRKAFLHGRKHSEFSTYLEQLWTSLSNEQCEFKIALAALSDSERYHGAISVDKSFLHEETQKRLGDLGILEISSESNMLTLPSPQDMIAELSPVIREARDNVELTLHKMIFSSNSARIRRMLSHSIFQSIFA